MSLPPCQGNMTVDGLFFRNGQQVTSYKLGKLYEWDYSDDDEVIPYDDKEALTTKEKWQWLEDNCRGEWISWVSNIDVAYVTFLDPKDEMLFKLTWGGA